MSLKRAYTSTRLQVILVLLLQLPFHTKLKIHSSVLDVSKLKQFFFFLNDCNQRLYLNFVVIQGFLPPR